MASPSILALALHLTLAGPEGVTPEDDLRRAYEGGLLSLQRQHYDLAVQKFSEARALATKLEPGEIADEVLDQLAYNFANTALTCHEMGQSEWIDGAEAALLEVFDRHPQPGNRYGDLLDRVQAAKRKRDALSPLTIAGITVSATSSVGVAATMAGLILGGQARTNYEEGPTREIRDEADNDGVRANRITLIGGITTGLLLATGVALIAVGQRRDGAPPSMSRRGGRRGHAHVSPGGLVIEF